MPKTTGHLGTKIAVWALIPFALVHEACSRIQKTIYDYNVARNTRKRKEREARKTNHRTA